MANARKFRAMRTDKIKENDREKTVLNHLPNDGRIYSRDDVAYWMGQEAIAFVLWVATNHHDSHEPVPILYQKFLNETKEVSNG